MFFAYYLLGVAFFVVCVQCFTPTSQVPRCAGGLSLRGLSLSQFVENVHSETALACCDEDGTCYENQRPSDLPIGTSTFDLNSTHWANLAKNINSRAKREVHFCPDDCPIPSEINVCPSNTSVLFPLSGTSIISEKRVDIAQYPPVFIQPVIYHRCLTSECRILGGSCVQVMVPQAVFVYVKQNEKVVTEIDFVYVEGGCKCLPNYGERLRGVGIEADPVIATVFRATTGRRLNFAALQAHLTSPNVLEENMRGPIFRVTPNTPTVATFTTDAPEVPTSAVTTSTTLPDPVTTTRSKNMPVTEVPLKDLIMSRLQFSAVPNISTVEFTRIVTTETTTMSAKQLTTASPVEIRRNTVSVKPNSELDSSIKTTLTEDNQSTVTKDTTPHELFTTLSLITADNMQTDASYPTTSGKTAESTQEDTNTTLFPAGTQSTTENLSKVLEERQASNVGTDNEITVFTLTENETEESSVPEPPSLAPKSKQSSTENSQELLWERLASNVDEDNDVDAFSLIEDDVEQPDFSHLTEDDENVVDQDDHVIFNEREDTEQAYTSESLSSTDKVDSDLVRTEELHTEHLTSSAAFPMNIIDSDPRSNFVSESLQTIVSTEQMNLEQNSDTDEAVGSASLDSVETEKLEDAEERSGEEESQARSLEPDDDEELEAHDSPFQDSYSEAMLDVDEDNQQSESLHSSRDSADSDPNLVLYDQNSMDPDDVFIDEIPDSETNELDFTESKLILSDQSDSAPLRSTSDVDEDDDPLSNELTSDLEESMAEPSDSEDPESRDIPEHIYSEAAEADGENEVAEEAEDSLDFDNSDHVDNELENLTPSVIYLDNESEHEAENPSPDSDDLESSSLEHEPVALEDPKVDEDSDSVRDSLSIASPDDVTLLISEQPELPESDTEIIISALETSTSNPDELTSNKTESYVSPFQYLLTAFTQFFATKEPTTDTTPPTVPDPTVEIPSETTESIPDEELRKPPRTLPVEELPCANCPISIPPKYFDPIKKLLKKYSS